MFENPLPQTLARMAGLSSRPARPTNSVLVMIDGQREYTKGLLPLAGIDAAVEECARLPACARDAGMPVIHAIHHGRPGAAAFDPAGEGARFIDALAPFPGETVLVKRLPNAFSGAGPRHGPQRDRHRRICHTHVRQCDGTRRAGSWIPFDRGRGRDRDARPAAPFWRRRDASGNRLGRHTCGVV